MRKGPEIKISLKQHTHLKGYYNLGESGEPDILIWLRHCGIFYVH